MEREANRPSQRTEYFDCLRILATLAVMILHVAAQNWYKADIHTYEWKMFNIYDSIVRWAVPIFVMISGALFLEGKQPIERIYKKNILRIITAFIFWSLLYAIVNVTSGTKFELKKFVFEVAEGHYHLWFLFMIVGLYIIIPLVRKMVETLPLTKYFLMVALVFSFIIPSLITFLSFRSKELSQVMNNMRTDMQFHLTIGQISYFVLGYYLNKVEISKKVRWIIYILGLLGFAMTIFLTYQFSMETQKPITEFYGHFTINVLLESMLIFVFAKNNFNHLKISERAKGIIRKLSQYSFGAYLVHALIIEQLNKLYGINTLSFNPLLSIPAITIVVFVVSFVISGILNQIPVVKKYIV